MDTQSLPILLVTANVGSVFEDPTQMLSIWIAEFLNTISRLSPSFIALHLQEVGGKTYEKSMQYVQEFVQTLCQSSQLKSFDTVHVYLDEDYSSAEHFTALGNLYFVHNSVKSPKIWDFTTQTWVNAEGPSIYTGNIEKVATKDKSKFPQHFFPECKWSRKGFLRTRWSLNGTVMDLVNIHLFHDASNLAASESFPSVYCKSRRRALQHTLDRFHHDTVNGTAPYFVFGDFNFRCDTRGVVEKLTENLTATRIQNNKSVDYTKVQYADDEGQVILTVGKKEFTHLDHQSIFKQDWLRQFDKELESLADHLFEYPINFAPTYPFEEDISLSDSYMMTRCPAWCDRILMSKTTKLILNQDENRGSEYGVIGENTCMGDHKPVFLRMWMSPNQGTIRCCEHEHAPKYCFLLPHNLTSAFNRNSSVLGSSIHNSNDNCNVVSLENFISPIINVTDTDFNLNICLCDFWRENETDKIYAVSEICKKCNKFRMKNTENLKSRSKFHDSYDSSIIVNRIDPQLLYILEQKHQDPYTPESLESHSPAAELAVESDQMDSDKEGSDVLEENIDDDKIIAETTELTVDTKPVKIQNDIPVPTRHGVSPRQLKSRLETILRESENNLQIKDNEAEKSSEKLKKKCCGCTLL